MLAAHRLSDSQAHWLCALTLMYPSLRPSAISLPLLAFRAVLLYTLPMRSFLVLFILLLAGCADRDTTPPEDLKRLADAHIAVMRFKANLSGNDSSEVAQGIADSLDAYGFSEETFERELLSLADSPGRLRQFNDLITARTK